MPFLGTNYSTCMFDCHYCGKTLKVSGPVVVACGCQESIYEDRKARQEKLNFIRQKSPDLSKNKRSSYRKGK